MFVSIRMCWAKEPFSQYRMQHFIQGEYKIFLDHGIKLSSHAQIKLMELLLTKEWAKSHLEAGPSRTDPTLMHPVFEIAQVKPPTATTRWFGPFEL